MASVFTYDPDPPRVSSPWSTPGSSTPRRERSSTVLSGNEQANEQVDSGESDFLAECGITKLDPEPQEGPTEYKLHLLLRPRKAFLSLSTGNITSGSSHSKSLLAASATSQDTPEMPPRPAQSPSNQSRQHRLHQLTTQLLWRLQQSSPFHSSSAASLVLPVLPEATPTLKVPGTRSPLLPGLEESQGALYEIGVSDDGSFVGLTEDELSESLVNLEAMAASLGCRVEVLRKIAVGHGEWVSEDPANVHSGKLWVAEALVSPDLKRPNLEDGTRVEPMGSSGPGRDNGLPSHINPTEQLHVAIAGPAGAGKSSLLGILSTSALDNGRGKSRLSLLKHRHEIASGVTSSIAQELIGYSAHTRPGSPGGKPDVLNYAAGNITSWNDIHASAGGGRLVFLSDLPGSLRYSKSTLRGLVSWRPRYVLLCVPASSPEGSESADPSQVDISLAYLELCVKLELPVMIVLTKLDAATRSVMKETLARILTAIKSTSREPIMLPASADIADQNLDLQHISRADDRDVHSASIATGTHGVSKVPILMTSAVTGAGIGKLHALLRSLPIPTTVETSEPNALDTSVTERTPGITKEFDINEVFEMPLFKVYTVSNENKRKDDRGIILCGRVRKGTICVGDRLVVGPISQDGSQPEGESNTQTTPHPKATPRKSSSDDTTSPRHRNGEPSLSPSPSRRCYWQEVRVVSVRNLRLPVKGLSEHQIGTIGVDPVGSVSCLGKIRKGMLLGDYGFPPTSSPAAHPELSPSLQPPHSFHTGFVAAFPSAGFANASSLSLATGGTAMAYIGSVRAAVKLVSAESSRDGQSIPSSMKDPDIFTLDDAASDTESSIPTNGFDAHQNTVPDTNTSIPSEDDIRISFSFVSSIEWIDVGSRVLVTPDSLTGVSGSSGLQGFVGRVCEVLS